MYRRYSDAAESTVSHAQVYRNRIRNILILLLLVVIGVLCYFGIPAIRRQGEQKTLFIQRMQAECDEAIRQTSTLSRSAGADSAAILARIRSNVYAIRTANNLSFSSGYGYLLADSEILAIQDSVDRYLSFLTTGMDTGEYQTNLQNSLTGLRAMVSNLE